MNEAERPKYSCCLLLDEYNACIFVKSNDVAYS